MRQAKSRREHNTGSIFKRKDGRWAVQVQNPNRNDTSPRYITRYAKSHADATKLLNELVSQLTLGQNIITKRQTVGEFLEHWLESFVSGSLEPKTITWYRMMVRQHLTPSLGRIDLRKLQPMQVQHLVNSKVQAGLSPATVRGIHSVLRTALNQAWKFEMVTENVAKKVTVPKQDQAAPSFLEPQDVRKLLEALKGHQIEGVVKMALGTGMRLGEVTGVRWEDIDLDSRIVRVGVQLQRLEGKLSLKALKSRSSRRSLPLLGLALEAVMLERERQAEPIEGKLRETVNPQNLVFLNSEGSPFDQKNVNHHLKGACIRAGVKPVSFHKLRHTAATLMVAAGVDLHQVKEQLGHSQISLTANLYAHGVSESQRRAANVLDRVLQSGELPQ